MNCKYCNAEMAEEMTVCPACGKEQQAAEAEIAEELAAAEVAAPEAATEEVTAEEVPAKTGTKKITAAVIALVLVAGILIGLVAGGLAGKPAAEPAGPEATVTATEPLEIPADGDPTSPLCKASYTVSDEEAIAAADVVVATMGDKTLTNAQLQAFYWQEIYMFLQENSSYAYYMGLDYYTPLDQQAMDMSGVVMSWQQFLLDGAIATWKDHQALALEGEQTGHQLSPERQEELQMLQQDLEDGALLSGFESADAMIAQNVGANCTTADYMNYVNTYYNGMSYYQSYCEGLEFTDEEIEAFYAQNEDYFAGSGITKDSKFVNVRHVLLLPNNGEYSETGEDGYPVYTDEAWEKCRLQAEELYSKWQEGDKSEASFATLAVENSADGNAAEGGIYEDVYRGQMVESFETWCFDESRQAGDHGLVRTQYGYHIMFYCGDRDWAYYTRNEMITDLAYEHLPALVEKFAPVVDFSKIQLCDIPLA